MVRALDVCQIVQMVQISRYLAQVVPSLVRDSKVVSTHHMGSILTCMADFNLPNSAQYIHPT